MNQHDTGGPAFSRAAGDYNGSKHGNGAQQGMTLRDYFAAKAMQGFITNHHARRSDLIDVPQLTKSAYDIADAMLKARQA